MIDIEKDIKKYIKNFFYNRTVRDKTNFKKLANIVNEELKKFKIFFVYG